MELTGDTGAIIMSVGLMQPCGTDTASLLFEDDKSFLGVGGRGSASAWAAGV